LPAPLASEYGQTKLIVMGANDDDDVTIDLDNVINVPDSDTLATFSSDGDLLVVLGSPVGWIYTFSVGAAFSQP